MTIQNGMFFTSDLTKSAEDDRSKQIQRSLYETKEQNYPWTLVVVNKVNVWIGPNLQDPSPFRENSTFFFYAPNQYVSHLSDSSGATGMWTYSLCSMTLEDRG